jgi:hypothetical protein
LIENLFDMDRLTRTAAAVLDDPAAFRPLGEAGRKLILSRYSQEVAHPNLKDYFERMASTVPLPEATRRGYHEETSTHGAPP